MTLFRDWKRWLTVLVAGVVGLIVLLDAVGLITPVAFWLVSWAATLTALALLVGLLSVAGTHLRRVRERAPDWGYSLILLAGMLAVIITGVFGGADVRLQQSLAEEPLRVFFSTVYEPLASSLLALLAFFSLSAALRALGQRRPEAWVIVGVALVVLLSQLAPVATLPYVGATMQWINDYVVLAGARGLLIGVALGTLVASMRVLLGFDQPYIDR
jgi:hypothetical protein